MLHKDLLVLKSSSAGKSSVTLLQHFSFSVQSLSSNGVQMYEKAGRGPVSFSSWDKGFFFSVLG